MKKEIVLKKVIQKAEKNGWSRNKHSNKLLARGIPYGKIGFESVIFDHSFAKAFFPKANYIYERLYCPSKKCGELDWQDIGLGGSKKEIADTIAAHKFCHHCGTKLKFQKRKEKYDNWQYHLQQLAISKNRLAYLEGFL